MHESGSVRPKTDPSANYGFVEEGLKHRVDVAAVMLFFGRCVRLRYLTPPSNRSARPIKTLVGSRLLFERISCGNPIELMDKTTKRKNLISSFIFVLEDNIQGCSRLNRQTAGGSRHLALGRGA